MIFRRLAGLVALAAVLSAHPAIAQTTYTWAGPFTGTGSTVNPWSAATSWAGGVAPPTGGGINLQLVFSNFDANVYSANNDLGNPFDLNGVTLQNFSQSGLTVNNSTTTTNGLRLGGANPTVTVSGPQASTFAATGGGLVLNPTSGTTTIQGAGNGVLTVGTTTAGVVVSGTGGLTVATTGLGGLSLFGPSATGNTFTGGVTLSSGGLTLNGTGTASVGSLGAPASNTLTVNGGFLRGSSATIYNPVALNSTLSYLSGTASLNGVVSGSGGISVASGNVAQQALTLGGANTFTGAVTVQNSQARPNGDPPFNLPSLTLASTGSLATTQTVTVGNNGTFVLAGNVATNRVPDAAPWLLNGGRLTVSTTGVGFAETLGTVTGSGLDVFTLSATAAGNALTLGAYNRQDNATLFFRGGWTGSSAGYGTLTFSGGLPTTSDPLGPSGGTNTAVVPFAAGNATATNVAATALLTYDGTGIRYLSPTGSGVAQLAAGGDLTSLPNQNVNLLGAATVPGAVRVNSLSATANSTLTGSGTVTVYSGAVLAGGGSTTPAMTWNGPTLAFGSTTGYLHVGGNLRFSGTSQITGTAGVVVSGLDNPGSGLTSNGAAYTVQFGSSQTAGNPFSGGLWVNGNTAVAFTADNQLGVSGGAITLGGGGLSYFAAGPSALTLSRPITLGPAGGSLSATSNNTLTVDGPISGTGGLTVFTGDTVTNAVVSLTGTNTYQGPTYLYPTGGTLRVAADGNLGAASQPLVLNGGTLQFAGSNAFTKPIQFNSAGVVLDTAGNSPTWAGSLSGIVASGWIKGGAGTLTLTNANPTLSGAVAVNGGTLRLAGAAGSLPQLTTATVANGAQLLLDNASTASTDRLPDQSRVALLAGGELVLNGGTETVGTLNPTTYPLTTQTASGLSQGTVTVSGNGVLSFQRLTPAFGGGVLFRGDGLGTVGGNRVLFAGRSSGFLPAAVYDPSATGTGTGPAFYDSTGTGVRAVTAGDYYPLPGTVIQNSAPVGVPPAAVARVAGAGYTTGAAAESNTIDSLTLAGGGGLTISNTLALGSGVLVQEAGSGTVTGGTLAVGPNPLSVYAAGNLILGGTLTGTGGITKLGAGTLTLSGTATGVTGPLGVSAGTLDVGTNSLTVTSLAGGGTLALNNTTLTIAAASTAPNVTFPGTITGGATGKLAYNPAIAGVAASVTLGGANTFGGGVTTTGTSTQFVLTNPQGFGTGPVSLAGDYLNAGTATPVVLFNFGTGAGGTVPNAFSLVATASNNQALAVSGSNQTVTLSGLLSAGPATGTARLVFQDLTLNGTDTFVLANPANAFGGTTILNVSSGFLAVTTGGAVNTASGIELASVGTQQGGLRFDGSFAVTPPMAVTLASQVNTNGFTGTLSGVVSGSAALTKTGAGTLVLGNTANTHTGAVNVNAGTLQVNGVVATGTNPVTVNGGGTLAGTGTVNRSLTVNAGGMVAAGTGGAGTLTVTGAGTFAASSALGVRVTTAGASSASLGGSTAGTLPNPTNTNFLNVNGNTLMLDPGLLVVIDGTGANFTPNQPYSYAVAQASTVSGLSGPITNPAQFTTIGFQADPSAFSLSQINGVVFLVFTPVPEPAAVLAVAAVGLVAVRRLSCRRMLTA